MAGRSVLESTSTFIDLPAVIEKSLTRLAICPAQAHRPPASVAAASPELDLRVLPERPWVCGEELSPSTSRSNRLLLMPSKGSCSSPHKRASPASAFGGWGWKEGRAPGELGKLATERIRAPVLVTNVIEEGAALVVSPATICASAIAATSVAARLYARRCFFSTIALTRLLAIFQATFRKAPEGTGAGVVGRTAGVIYCASRKGNSRR